MGHGRADTAVEDSPGPRAAPTSGHRPDTPGAHAGTWTYRVEWRSQESLLEAETRVSMGFQWGVSAFIRMEKKEKSTNFFQGCFRELFTNFFKLFRKTLSDQYPVKNAYLFSLIAEVPSNLYAVKNKKPRNLKKAKTFKKTIYINTCGQRT